MRKKGFDEKKYVELSKKEILKRVKKFNNKLYLEIGGKLFDDYHASRVLPGFKYNSKLEILKSIKDKLEVVICISSKDIERHKIRADYNITYDVDVMRLIDKFRENSLLVNGVVITLFEGQPSAVALKNKLELNGIKVYIHYYTEGYPTDIDKIASENGYGRNEYIETSKPVVVVTAPGPGSGKLGTCLSQLYHEHNKGLKAGYAKLETFPVWNLPLKHPVNVAYEAATVDLKDVNMIDPFHMQAYNKIAINYNRDIEVFPVLKTILKRITNEDVYASPTDMGINMIGVSIKDDEIICKSSESEIIRRYYKALVDYKLGNTGEESSQRIKMLMNELNIDVNKRKVVKYANNKKQSSNTHAMAIELPSGKIITGRTTDYMTAPASTILNALKCLAKLDMDVHIISPLVIEPMIKMKKELFDMGERLNIQDVLLALSVNAATNPIIDKVLSELPKLNNVEGHITCIPSDTDDKTLKVFGINYTCDAVSSNMNLYTKE